MTAQAAVAELMITLFDRNLGVRVVTDHVHVIHVMYMRPEVRVRLVMTEGDRMHDRSVATVPTHRRHEGCRGKRKKHDQGCCHAEHCAIQYKQFSRRWETLNDPPPLTRGDHVTTTKIGESLLAI
jgi:hypothetical protein